MMFVAGARGDGRRLHVGVNGALTRGLALLPRHCVVIAATLGEKKGTREVQAPFPSELDPEQKHGVRRWTKSNSAWSPAIVPRAGGPAGRRVRCPLPPPPPARPPP